VELTHEFTVPTGPGETWAAFNDIESVAGCFPGATVTAVEGDTFEGSVKVKLGPIALVYNGAGTFTEKDEAAGQMLISAKGKDKRGNGTAGAEVTLTMTESGPAETLVHVVTLLQITGKPAQFGRSVMQDVSDKLLGKFTECLHEKLAGPAVPAADQDAGPASQPSGAAAEPAPAGDEDSGPSSPPTPPAPTPRGSDDAIDLGTTVLPVLVKTYGRQIVGVVVVLLLSWWWWRRRSSAPDAVGP
jgi:carbon monoxide dehydrogenase subunit G